MKTKTSKANANKATIEGADPKLAELAEILPDYAYESHEERFRSRGNNSLYIRLTRIRPVVRLAVAAQKR